MTTAKKYSKMLLVLPKSGLIVLGFNDTSTIVGHFVSSLRKREKRDRRDFRGDERDDREERGIGMKVKKQKK